MINNLEGTALDNVTQITGTKTINNILELKLATKVGFGLLHSR